MSGRRESASRCAPPAPRSFRRRRRCGRRRGSRRGRARAARSRLRGHCRCRRGARAAIASAPRRHGGSSPARPSSGSRNGRLSVHRALASRVTARDGRATAMCGRRRDRGTPGSWNQRTALPNRCAWSIVCGAPTPMQLRGAIGREHDHRHLRLACLDDRRVEVRPPPCRSCTAALPARRSSPRPSATNAATRSSCTTCSANSRRSASASAIGVLRDPGATTAWRTPRRTHSSTSVEQNVACTSAASIAPGRYGRRVAAVASHAFPGHAGRRRPLTRWRSLARIGEMLRP